MDDLSTDPIANLLSRWYDLFGYTPVTVRTVATAALEHDANLLAALVALVPEFAEVPQPKVISRWLLRHENFPLAGPSQTFRMVRVKTTLDGALWRLTPVEVSAAAVA